MIDIASHVALCESAIAGGSKAVEAVRRRKLTDKERDLLAAAAEQGQFFIMSVGQIAGSWVRVGTRDFIDNSEPMDPAFAARYMDAFRSLCEHGYIVHEGGKLFVLSGAGFDRARSL